VAANAESAEQQRNVVSTFPLSAELDMNIKEVDAVRATRKPLRREEEPQVAASVFYALNGTGRGVENIAESVVDVEKTSRHSSALI
jgi:hypothetical protein